LYHLAEDPEERRNRYLDPAAREVRDRLQARLEAWMRSIRDPLLGELREGD
jgi:hypothetical protein